MIVYNNKTGVILAYIPDDQFPRKYNGIPEEDVSTIKLNKFPNDDRKFYLIIGGELVRRTDDDIQDIIAYGRVITEEERVNILLEPSYEEIAKAESTLEILSTLQEVGLI